MNNYYSILPPATFSAAIMLSTLSGAPPYNDTHSVDSVARSGDVYHIDTYPTHETVPYRFADGYTANDIFSAAQARFVDSLYSSMESLGADFAKVMDDNFFDLLA